MTNEMIRFLNDLKGNPEMVLRLHGRLMSVKSQRDIFYAIAAEGYKIEDHELLVTIKKFFKVQEKIDANIGLTEEDYELIKGSYDEAGYPLGIFKGLGEPLAKALAHTDEHEKAIHRKPVV